MFLSLPLLVDVINKEFDQFVEVLVERANLVLCFFREALSNHFVLLVLVFFGYGGQSDF